MKMEGAIAAEEAQQEIVYEEAEPRKRSGPAVTIAFANNKGGIGKTTTCFNVGTWLAREGYKVLMLDMDPSGSLSMSAGYPPLKPVEYGLLDLIEQRTIKGRPVHYSTALWLTNVERLDIVPGDHRLERWNNSQVGQRQKLTKLRDVVELLRDDYDYILIDTCPALSAAIFNALLASDYLLIPTTCAKSSVVRVVDMLSQAESLNNQFQHNLRVMGVVPTMVPKRRTKIIQRWMDTLPEIFPVLPEICFSRLVDAFEGDQLPVSEAERWRPVSRDYKTLTEEIIRLADTPDDCPLPDEILDIVEEKGKGLLQ